MNAAIDNEKVESYEQSVKDIENAVKAIFKPMKGKFVTITSLSDSLANIVANFSDVVEDQVGIDSVKICREVAKSLRAIARHKLFIKLKEGEKK